MLIDMRYPRVAKYINTDGVETYTNGAVCGKAMSGNIKVDYEDVPIYGDGGRVDLGKVVNGGSLQIDVSRVSLAIKGIIGGHTYAAATSGETPTGEKLTVKQGDESAEVGFGFVYTEVDDSKTRHHYGILIPRITFSTPSEKYKTKGKTTEYQAQTLEGDFLPTVDERLYEIQEFTTAALALAHIDSVLGISA